MPTPQEYRTLELDAAASTAVGRPSTALSFWLKAGVCLGAVAVAAWMIHGSMGHGPKSLTAPEREEFTTTRFPAPSQQPERRAGDTTGTIVVPPAPVPPADAVPPPPPPAPPAALPAPPPPEPAPVLAQPGDDEAQRLAELERLRQEEERRRWERFRAPQVVTDGAALPGEGSADADAGRGTGGADDDPNHRLLTSVSAQGVETAKATRNNRIDALVAQGTMIRGVLETALQSDLPGMVRAVTAENVWSFDGRRILIPAGTRLVGEYKSGIAQGQTRVFVVWTRLLRSDGVSVQLGSNDADDLGRAGNAGFVDNHYLERFGSAVMLSLVGGGAQCLSSYGQSTDNNGAGAVTTTTDPVTGLTTTTQSGIGSYLSLQARQIAAQNVSQTLTTIAQDALRNSINIPPTIYLDQGSKVIVFVRRDLDFSSLYPDPVKEALREIKRERGLGKPDPFPR